MTGATQGPPDPGTAGPGTAGPGAGSFPDRARALLAEAALAYRGRPAEHRLRAVAEQLDGPLRVAIAGRVKAGKSTLLNALVGARIAATDAGECTRVVTWYRFGPQPTATAHLPGDRSRRVPLTATGRGYDLDLGDLRADDLTELTVELPNEWLARMTLIDTPGMGSLSTALARRASDLLADPAEGAGRVDAVLYLLRQLHTADVDFLEVFHEAQFSLASPVNAVGVLSRADEIGGGTPDAMTHAHRVAAGYRGDPRIRSLVHTVLPVAGLLAEASTTIGAVEFADLVTLAAAGPAATAPMVLSAARFGSPTAGAAVPAERRQRLLDLLGMYGVRLAIRLIQSDRRSPDRDHLVAELTAHSGLPQLRRLLVTQFAERREVLKADSALRVVDAVTATDPVPAAGRLREQVERLRANAHELAEIRLLTEVRTGQLEIPADRLSTMERLLGGDGTAVTTRLGLPAGASDADVASTLAEAHARWHRLVTSPLTAPALARSAAVVLRTCEGLLAAARTPPP